MQPVEIFDLLKKTFSDTQLELTDQGPSDPFVTVEAGKIREVCRFLRDRPELSFDYLRCLSGVEAPESMAVVYHLYSLRLRHSIVVKVLTEKENPEVDSVHDIWSAANWYEREAWDLLGIRFRGHPRLERIMLPPDWVGHPLRKDYVPPRDFHGIPTSRPDEESGGGNDA